MEGRERGRNGEWGKGRGRGDAPNFVSRFKGIEARGPM